MVLLSSNYAMFRSDYERMRKKCITSLFEREAGKEKRLRGRGVMN